MMAALRPISGLEVDGRIIFLESLTRANRFEEMGDLQVLFVGEGIDGAHVSHLLASLEGKPVLTVSALEGFVEMGGMVEFVRHRNRVRFSLNPVVAKRQGLRMRARLQRLAIRIANAEESP